jgi:hypothetical protein
MQYTKRYCILDKPFSHTQNLQRAKTRCYYFDIFSGLKLRSYKISLAQNDFDIDLQSLLMANGQ